MTARSTEAMRDDEIKAELSKRLRKLFELRSRR
jgi:hypothetical protein